MFPVIRRGASEFVDGQLALAAKPIAPEAGKAASELRGRLVGLLGGALARSIRLEPFIAGHRPLAIALFFGFVSLSVLLARASCSSSSATRARSRAFSTSVLLSVLLS